MGIKLELLYGNNDLDYYGNFELCGDDDSSPAILFYKFDWTDWDGNTHHIDAMNNGDGSINSIEEYLYILTHYKGHLKLLEPMVQDFVKQAKACVEFDYDDFKDRAQEMWDEDVNECQDKYDDFEEYWENNKDEIYNDESSALFDSEYENLMDNHKDFCDFLVRIGHGHKMRIKVKNKKGEWEEKTVEKPDVFCQYYNNDEVDRFIIDILEDTEENFQKYYMLKEIDFSTLDKSELREGISGLFNGDFDC
jgi:hypothetical protein